MINIYIQYKFLSHNNEKISNIRLLTTPKNILILTQCHFNKWFLLLINILI